MIPLPSLSLGQSSSATGGTSGPTGDFNVSGGGSSMMKWLIVAAVVILVFWFKRKR